MDVLRQQLEVQKIYKRTVEVVETENRIDDIVSNADIKEEEEDEGEEDSQSVSNEDSDVDLDNLSDSDGKVTLILFHNF